MAKNKAFLRLRNPSSLIASALLALIKCYRYAISGLLGHCCRFEPSCSTYAMEAIQRHGCFKGTCLAMRRLCRCHPWHPGGMDNVP